MNTCVLCLSRRNAFACTIRSRSRWNGVRTGESCSGIALRGGYERVGRGENRASSKACMRSLKELTATGSPVLMAMIRLSQQGWRDLTAGSGVVTEIAGLLLAHLGHLHAGLNIPFVLYAAQLAFCAGFIYW